MRPKPSKTYDFPEQLIEGSVSKGSIEGIKGLLESGPPEISVILYIDSSYSMLDQVPTVLTYCRRLMDIVKEHSGSTLKLGLGRFEDGKAGVVMPPARMDDAGQASLLRGIMSIGFGKGLGNETPYAAFEDAVRFFRTAGGENSTNVAIAVTDGEERTTPRDMDSAATAEGQGVKSIILSGMEALLPSEDGRLFRWKEMLPAMKTFFDLYVNANGDEGRKELGSWAAESPLFLFRLAAASALFPDKDVPTLIRSIRDDEQLGKAIEGHKPAWWNHHYWVHDESCPHKERRCEIIPISFYVYLDILSETNTPEMQAFLARDILSNPFIDHSLYLLRGFGIDPVIMAKAVFTLRAPVYERDQDFVRDLFANPAPEVVNEIVNNIIALFDSGNEGDGVVWWEAFENVPEIKGSEVILSRIKDAAGKAVSEEVIEAVLKHRLFDEPFRATAVERGIRVRGGTTSSGWAYWRNALSKDTLKEMAKAYFQRKGNHYYYYAAAAFEGLDPQGQIEVISALAGSKEVSSIARRYLDARLFGLQGRWAEALRAAIEAASHEKGRDCEPFRWFIEWVLNTRGPDEYIKMLSDIETGGLKGQADKELFKSVAKRFADRHIKEFCDYASDRLKDGGISILGKVRMMEVIHRYYDSLKVESPGALGWVLMEDPEANARQMKSIKEWIAACEAGTKCNTYGEALYRAFKLSELLRAVIADKGIPQDTRLRALYKAPEIDRTFGYDHIRPLLEGLSRDVSDPLYENILGTLATINAATPDRVWGHHGDDGRSDNEQTETDGW